MNIKLLSLCAAAAMAALALSTGCVTRVTTGPTGAPITNSVPDVVKMSAVARSATYLGTSIYLNGLGDKTRVVPHPEARPQFELVRTSLKTLIAAGTFSAADLTAALQSLPVKELQGSDGTLIVGEAVLLWDEYGQALATLDQSKIFDTYLLPVARAIVAGLDQALGPPMPPATK
jgi:hypothetical protein